MAPGSPAPAQSAAAPTEPAADEGSKVKGVVAVLRRWVWCGGGSGDGGSGRSITELVLTDDSFIGVADLAAVRFSLPAHLIEPIPNLGA